LATRHIFRQVDYRDLECFLRDGEIRSKRHFPIQKCHQTSHVSIVDRRGTQDAYPMPCGGTVNDYVPFYFSPLTSFTYSVYKSNVQVISPKGNLLGMSSQKDRIFFVGRTERIHQLGLTYCFSNLPLNARAPLPTVEQNLDKLEDIVHWRVFDEPPRYGAIQEIGYLGVHGTFRSEANPNWKMNRSRERMAEFLVRDTVPMNALDCIIVENDAMKNRLQPIVDKYPHQLPIYINRGCFWP